MPITHTTDNGQYFRSARLSPFLPALYWLIEVLRLILLLSSLSALCVCVDLRGDVLEEFRGKYDVEEVERRFAFFDV